MINNKKILIITFAKEKKNEKKKKEKKKRENVNTWTVVYMYMNQCFSINCDYINSLFVDL